MEFILKLPKKQLVFFILLVGLGLRYYNLENRGIWIDEEVTLLITHGLKHDSQPQFSKAFSNEQIKAENTFENVRKNTVQDNGNASLYNFSEHYWMQLIGKGFVGGRYLSLLFSGGILLLVFLFCYYNINYETAIVALLLMSFNPISIAYAQEMRTYSMATFLSLSATWLFYHLFIKEKNNEKYAWLLLLLYSLSGGLSLMAHYLSSAVFIAHGVVALLVLRDKKKWIQLSAGVTALFALFSIWLLNGGLDGLKIMGQQGGEYSKIAANYQQGDSTFLIPATFQNIVIGWFQVLLQEFGNGMQAFFQVRYIAILMLIPFFFIGYYFFKEKEKNKVFILTVIAIITQLLFATFLAFKSGHTTSFQPLYANFIVPFAMILFALALVYFAQKNSKIAWGTIIFQLLISSYSIGAVYNNIPDTRKENRYPEIAKMIEEEYKTNDTIVCGSQVKAKLLSIHLDADFNCTYKIDSTKTNGIQLKSEFKSVTFVVE